MPTLRTPQGDRRLRTDTRTYSAGSLRRLGTGEVRAFRDSSLGICLTYAFTRAMESREGCFLPITHRTGQLLNRSRWPKKTAISLLGRILERTGDGSFIRDIHANLLIRLKKAHWICPSHPSVGGRRPAARLRGNNLREPASQLP